MCEASTIGALRLGAEKFLREANIESPKWDVEQIIASVIGCSRLELYLKREQQITLAQKERINQFLIRRAAHEPLQYLLGEVGFCDLRLLVDPRVLIPRSETELLIEWIEHYFSKKKDLSLNILDLGTGSGAIALSLAKFFPKSQVLAVDISSDALEVAQKNAQLNQIHNVCFLQSNWFEALQSPDKKSTTQPTTTEKNFVFDLIVANPPYLTDSEYQTAQEEVRNFEPKLALVAENWGMADLEKILDTAPEYLTEHGMVALETGILHPKKLQKKYQNRYSMTRILQDLSHRDRFFIAER